MVLSYKQGELSNKHQQRPRVVKDSAVGSGQARIRPVYQAKGFQINPIDIQKFPNEYPFSSKEEEEDALRVQWRFGVRFRVERKFVATKGSDDLICVIISEYFHKKALPFGAKYKFKVQSQKYKLKAYRSIPVKIWQ